METLTGPISCCLKYLKIKAKISICFIFKSPFKCWLNYRISDRGSTSPASGELREIPPCLSLFEQELLRLQKEARISRGDSWILRKIIIILQLYPIISVISHEISSCCLVIIKNLKPLYGGSKPCYPRSLGTSKYLVNGWFFPQGMGQIFSAPGTGNRRPRGGGRKGGSCRLGVKSVISWIR